MTVLFNVRLMSRILTIKWDMCFVAIPLLKLGKLISLVEQIQNKSWIPDTNVWLIVCKETNVHIQGRSSYDANAYEVTHSSYMP